MDWLCTAGTYFILKTARENILFGNREATEEELEKRLKLQRLKDLEFLPEGLETLVGEKGVSLSGGQNKGFRLHELLFKIRKY